MPPATRILLFTLLAQYALALQRQQPYRHDAYPSRAPNFDTSAERWANADGDSLQTSLSGQRGYRNTYSDAASDNERALATLSPAENSAVRVPPAPR